MKPERRRCRASKHSKSPCKLLASCTERVDSVEGEKSLNVAVYLDSKAELLAQTKRLAGSEPLVDRVTASKLLHVCCNLDSAECASALLGGELGAIPLVNELDDSGKSPLHTAAAAHAARCVEVLLEKHARTDLRTKDGRAQLALELSLCDERIDVNWNLNDFSIEDLVIHMSEKDLSAVKLLCVKTKEIAEVAYAYAVQGRVAALTALLIVAAEKVNDSVLELRDSEWDSKEKVTVYECLIREALALGRSTTPSTATESGNLEKKEVLLREIELLQLFGAVGHSGGADKKVTTPLIRAAREGDEAVIQLLLKTNIDVNDADADGNSALHWILRLSRLLCPQQIKILSLLLEHGARVSQRNKLGLTAFHIAASNGNSVALEVLLLEDPDGVQYKTEMQETPLFFAVKNRSMDCAELLLTWGANSEIFNLRGQRAIDLATSQDMRYILLNPTTVSLIKHAFPTQDKCTALELTDEDTTTERNAISSTKAEVCKYFNSHQGCVGGAKCFYAHCEEESWKVKEGADWSHYPAAKQLKRKIFVGGLSSSVDSDVLGKFFEEEFGSVEDAIVIVTRTENKVQSRGFGFVTFREEKSVLAAVQADNVTLRGKQIEIKILNPKLVFASKFEKMSPQQREIEKNFRYQLPLEKSNEKIMKGDHPKQGSWADRLLLEQPKACSIEPQAHITKSSEDPSTPAWLKVFKKWFLGFLQGLPKHPKYALSSLKADFRAKFGLELDHSPLGYSKLSDFLKCFSDLCTIEFLPICKRGPRTHMILRPKFPRHQRRLLHTHKTPHTLSFSALIENGGDLKCLPDLSIGDGNESKCLQDKYIQYLSADDGGDSEWLQNLSVDGSSDMKCLHNLSAGNAVDSKNVKYHQEVSICNAREKYNLNVTSNVEEKPSCVYQEMKNCAENKSHCVHSGQLHGQKEIDVLPGETDNGSIGDNNMSKSYFIRESNFCKAEVIGTTNIACPLPEGIMIAFDSRVTAFGKIASDITEKFTLITPSILATMCGNVYEVQQTWNHMKRFISNDTAEGSDPLHVYSASNIGLRMGRSADAKSFEFFIAGLQSGTPTCYHLDYENEKHKKLDKIEMSKAVGSGASFAEIAFMPNCKGHGNNVPLEEAIQRVCWALLIAALHDKHTGGILTVIYVGPNCILVKSSKTVLALYLEFYDVSLRLIGDEVNEDGSNTVIPTRPFSALEGISVFLFYVPCNVDQASLLKRLSKNRVIRKFGHPLTELADGYYMHRVLFERNIDSVHFLKEAVKISNHMVLPFSKSRDFRYVSVRKQTIFVASQSMEMLQSLEVSKSLQKILVLPTREQCVEERVKIRNTVFEEQKDKLQMLQPGEEQLQLQRRKKWPWFYFSERETEEQTERERLQKQWFLEQEKIQNEPLQITYSYWDGAGHRQTIQVRKGDKIGDFLRSVQQQLAPEFQEVRTTSVENLLYVKEDLIIPHQHSFYELIINKARGKSGPLFHFDVHEDVRTIADATIEKDEPCCRDGENACLQNSALRIWEGSHAGKVVERHWYEKNKHIFPASRWEIYDPTNNGSVTPSTGTD